ncbi:hypothetical protein [Winogradskyella rapida]|uniref:C1q domain-containing protein n=1 Tax=Winogradskyella rapida TaxID=549701 RepID=A0ABW3KR49_9FLAO
MKTDVHLESSLNLKTVILFLSLFVSSFTFAQVAIGNTDPKASLDISASNQASPSFDDGLLIPRIDTFPTTNPTSDQDGMLVYLTTTVGTSTRGFYYWNNGITEWVRFSNIEKLNDLSDAKSDDDGSDNGSSIFIGENAGANDDATDNNNIGIGYNALQLNTDGNHNTALGYATLKFSTGSNNSAFGYVALENNTTGAGNSAFGKRALEANTSSNHNTAMGSDALRNNTGATNTALGNGALFTNTTGDGSVAIGHLALRFNTTGAYSTAIGTEALTNNTVSENTAVGYRASFLNNDGEQNTSVGYEALYSNISGNSNTAFGHGALRSNTANNNVAFGNNSLFSSTSGTSNVAIGTNAGSGNTTGADNVLIGFNSGSSLTGGSKNVFIGKNTGRYATGSNNVFIGDNAGLHTNFYTVNHSLVISNNNGPTPLIYGEFDNDILRVNGELQVAEPGANNGYAFPTVDGTADQILVTDGAGQLTFEDQTPDISTFPIIRATMSANQTLATGGWEKINFNTVSLNATSSSEFDTANNQFVAANTGIYRINASFHTTASQANTQYYGIAVYINGTIYQEYTQNHYYNGTTASPVARQISCVAEVNAGETIAVFVQNYQTGVVLDAYGGKTHFTIERIR